MCRTTIFSIRRPQNIFLEVTWTWWMLISYLRMRCKIRTQWPKEQLNFTVNSRDNSFKYRRITVEEINQTSIQEAHNQVIMISTRVCNRCRELSREEDRGWGIVVPRIRFKAANSWSSIKTCNHSKSQAKYPNQPTSLKVWWLQC